MFNKIIYLILVIIIFFSCSSPKSIFIPKQNDQNYFNGNDNEISIITYNIQTVFGKGEEQINGLIEYLNDKKFDFITMQEVFDENAREKLIANLNPDFYKGIIPRVDYDSFPLNISQDAGLFSASKFPQIDLSKYNFPGNTEFSNGGIHTMLEKKMSISLDFLANKSVLGSLHQINDSTKLFLFTTHLQAISSNSHRTYQLLQIYSFIANSVAAVVKQKLVNSPENLIVLLTGDLNYNAYAEGDIETLKQFLGNPRDLHQEFNEENKEYTMMSKLLGFYVRFDYIFAYDNIGFIPLRRVKVNSINVTDVLDSTRTSISDHLAIKANLKID